MTQASIPTIGFVGLGNIGGPMARNMAVKHDGDVLVCDMKPAALQAVADTKARVVGSLAELGAQADVVFMSLPGSSHVEAVCLGENGLTSGSKRPSIIVDLSTTQVATARKIAPLLAALGVEFADAPVARTAESARRGELSIMVGAEPGLFTRIEPWLRYIGSDVTLCGGVGCGQVVKLINNALVFENTAALAEMMVLGQRAGVEPALLLDAVSKGSGDSFVLRNHGRKAMLPREFPQGGFPPEYALKDIDYVMELADQTNTASAFTGLARRYYASAAKNGLGGRYFPIVIEVVDKNMKVA
ncbi:NAD(P)-dependent oxidoreductase [Diaphorobacter sp. HDW4A]|uniref:NAD(P)-dependent oxidoreductase n=1 Tax=Diaphorobacter sp. HDW4A TaxID=2714924 RepID=UPI0014078D44|nr:NAD(P)-dependent oxidoreductase [Diaphorobacter sp. HDW4A]QIL79964.1 NAD(P)-dependent oxidoreductase [Diaphorobacter sp. HDW4A]